MVKTKTKNMPQGVKIISILYYVAAAIYLLMGILLIAGGGVLSSLNLEGSMPWLAALGGGLLVLGGVIAIAFGVLDFFIAKNLNKGKEWARIIVIVFSVIGFVSALMSLIGGSAGSIISLALNGWIGWYLWLNKETKKYFH